MIVVPSRRPNRNSLGDPLNRDWPYGVKGKTGVAPMDKVHPRANHKLVLDI